MLGATIEGCEIGVVLAIHRHRHWIQPIGRLTPEESALASRTMAPVLRLDEMPAAEATIAEMIAEFDIGWHMLPDADQSALDTPLGIGEPRLTRTVIGLHVVCTVPLDRQFFMRNG